MITIFVNSSNKEIVDRLSSLYNKINKKFPYSSMDVIPSLNYQDTNVVTYVGVDCNLTEFPEVKRQLDANSSFSPSNTETFLALFEGVDTSSENGITETEWKQIEKDFFEITTKLANDYRSIRICFLVKRKDGNERKIQLIFGPKSMYLGYVFDKNNHRKILPK